MQNWKQLYLELCQTIKPKDEFGNPLMDDQQNELGIPEINWVDMWNSQVYNLEGEHPFPAPAIFFAFRGVGTDDLGNNAQKVNLQVDVFIFWETFLDTFQGAYNQDSALRFLDIIDKVNNLLHGSSGKNYSSMRRVSFSPVDTMGAGNLFNVTYTCQLIDYSACKEFEEGSFEEVSIEAVGNQFIIPG